MNLVMKNIDEINKEQIKKLRETKKLVDFNPGDTVKVNVRIVEGKKQRAQAYEGVCIAKKTEVLIHLLRCEKFLLEKELKEFSNFIVQT